MDNRTARKWATGLQAANFASNLLGGLYKLYADSRARSQAGDAYKEWQAGQMQPSTATPNGSVQIENPMGGGAVDIPTFETKPPQMGPVDADALASLYAAMAGADPTVAAPYLDAGRQLYGVHTEDSRYRQQRGDQIADRDYTRQMTEDQRRYEQQQAEAQRQYETRMQVAGTLTGEKGQYDITDLKQYIEYLLGGGGELIPALSRRPEQINPLGVIQGRGGVFIPYQQGQEFGGAEVKSGIPLRDPTAVSSGGGGMTDAEKRGLTDAYAESQIVQQQLDYINAQEEAVKQALRTASSWDKPKLQEKLAEFALKKIEIQGQLMRLRTEIQTRETGQVVRPGAGTQPAAAQNPY